MGWWYQWKCTTTATSLSKVYKAYFVHTLRFILHFLVWFVFAFGENVLHFKSGYRQTLREAHAGLEPAVVLLYQTS